MDTFNSASTFPRMWNMELVWDDCQFQIVSVIFFLMICGYYMKILFILKVKTLQNIKMLM